MMKSNWTDLGKLKGPKPTSVWAEPLLGSAVHGIYVQERSRRSPERSGSESGQEVGLVSFGVPSSLNFVDAMADAPRFRFWWERVEGTSILRMSREDWDDLVGLLGEPVAVDVRETPLAGVAQASSVVASVAHRFGPATARLSVFRYDQADEPTPINQDEYDVWTDLAAHPRLGEMVNAASTSLDPNFHSFCRENVFLVKREAGADHWLPTIPSSITVLLKKT